MLSVGYVCQRHVGEGKWRECEGQLLVQMVQLLLILIR